MAMFILGSLSLCAQPAEVLAWDNKDWQSIPYPPAQVDSLCEWAWQVENASPEAALAYSEQAIAIAQENEYETGLATALKRRGTAHRLLGNFAKALADLQGSWEIWHKLGAQKEEAVVDGKIARLYMDQGEWKRAREYFQKAFSVWESLREPAEAVHSILGIGFCMEEMDEVDSALTQYRKAIRYSVSSGDSARMGEAWNSMGTAFFRGDQLDSAAHYWQLALHFTEEAGTYGYADVLNNLGLVKLESGSPSAAIHQYFLPALNAARDYGEPTQIRDLLFNLSLAYDSLGKYDSAYIFHKAYTELSDSIFTLEKANEVARLETRFQVAEKDAQNQLLASEGQRKSIVIWAVSVIAILGGIIALLAIRHQRRKRQAELALAEQQHKADTQRIVDLIQTQELRTLEALMEGEERERSRLASELHDSMGSLLATVKLYFSQLEDYGPELPDAFLTGMTLLDQACQSVRNYSHDLAGLPVARFGLVNAVRDLADSISGAGALQVKVFAHQMEERLPMAKERTLYKVIQELLTNIIKHSGATSAIVQFSRHPGYVNLLVEDNGKGMHAKSANSGLGLRSMRQRIEAIGGEMTIDSHPGRGTTLNIDLPLTHDGED